MLTNILTENEKRIRKFWLILTCIRFAIVFVMMLLQMNDVTQIEPIDLACFTILGFLIPLTLPFYFICRNIYKKHGTALLRFFLFITPAPLIRDGMVLLKEANPLLLSIFLVDLGLILWWCVLSWKLLKINQSLKEYKKAILVRS